MNDRQFETNEMMMDRAQRIKAFLREHIAKNPISGNERIAVVCHSTVIKALGSTGYLPDGKLNGYHPKNCEIQPFEV